MEIEMDFRDRALIQQLCTELSHDFAFHIDRRDYAGLAAVFAENGAWVRHGERLSGRKAIVEAMRARPSDRFARHLTTNVHFTKVSELLAKAVVTNIAYFAKHEGDPPVAFQPEQCMVIEFADVYVLTADGWRIFERDTQPIFVPAHMHNEMMGRH